MYLERQVLCECLRCFKEILWLLNLVLKENWVSKRILTEIGYFLTCYIINKVRFLQWVVVDSSLLDKTASANIFCLLLTLPFGGSTADLGYIYIYINGKLIKFSKCWRNQFFIGVFHKRIQKLFFPIERFHFWRSQVPQNPISATTCHLANFSIVCRQKTCWEFFIRRVVSFLELINENFQYSKCKSQERTP